MPISNSYRIQFWLAAISFCTFAVTLPSTALAKGQEQLCPGGAPHWSWLGDEVLGSIDNSLDGISAEDSAAACASMNRNDSYDYSDLRDRSEHHFTYKSRYAFYPATMDDSAHCVLIEESHSDETFSLKSADTHTSIVKLVEEIRYTHYFVEHPVSHIRWALLKNRLAKRVRTVLQAGGSQTSNYATTIDYQQSNRSILNELCWQHGIPSSVTVGTFAGYWEYITQQLQQDSGTRNETYSNPIACEIKTTNAYPADCSRVYDGKNDPSGGIG